LTTAAAEAKFDAVVYQRIGPFWKEGLKIFPIEPNFMQSWALRGEGLWYDGQALFEYKESYPAIIDTGSEDIAVPPEILKDSLNFASMIFVNVCILLIIF
jgi:hypothetical protein